MFLQKPCLLVILFFLGLVSNLKSQIVASSTVGCAPLSVNLSGPGGATNVFWNLGSGIGTTTLSNPNPIYNSAGLYNVTYTALVGGSPVNYNIQIKVNPSPSGSFSYILPISHCAPMTVTFTANSANSANSFNWSYGDLSSTIGGGTMVTHVYNNVGSYVPVVTVVDFSTGCTGLATPLSPATIKVSSPPNVIISSSQGFIGCNPPFNTVLTGSQSSGSSNALPLSFNWVIGGGSPGSSNLPTPGSVSFSAGQNTITLTITDNNQCSNSASTIVNVVTPVLSVSVQPSVCANAMITVTVNSTDANVSWASTTYTSTTTNSTVPISINSTMAVGNYTSGGIKTYTMSINPGGTCPPVSSVGSIFVENVIASYTSAVATPTTFCSSPHTFTLLNTSSVNNGSTLSYTWTSSVGTGGAAYNHIVPTSSASTNPSVSPIFTISQGSNSPYTCYDIFSPGVLLLAQSNSPLQCSAVSLIYWGMFNLWRPTAWFNKSKSEGCAPVSLVFRDSSSACNSAFAINGYTLHFGTSPPTFTTGTVANFTVPYTYSTTGTYSPYLQIQTSAGCTSTSYTDIITVVGQPTISGSLVPTSACAGTSVTINMNGTVNTVGTSSTVNHWHVTTDNQYFSGCVSNQNPSFPFTHTGTHTIGITGYQSGCASSMVIGPTINIKGPWGQTRFQTTCVGDKKNVNFYTYLQDVQTAVLNFGDGTPASNLLGVPGSSVYITTPHTYTGSGNYTVTLVSTGPSSNGCAPRTFTTLVKIRQPDANILFNGLAVPALPNAMACVTDTYNFTSSTSIDVNTTCRTGYIWNLITPTYTMPTWENSDPHFGPPGGLYHTFPPPPWAPLPPPYTIFDTISHDHFLTAGIYTISLTVRDENDCLDTETKIFRISSAKPQFTFNANPVCLSAGSVQLVNSTQSVQVNPDVITSYTFDFGEGFSTSVITSTNPAYSPTYAYSYAFPPSQVFNVVVTAQNNLGCIGSTTHTLQVNNPDPGLQPINQANYFPCIKKSLSTTVNFTANPGYATYSVNFGVPPSNWQTSNVFGNVAQVYNTPGIYLATLSVVDAGGCKATQVKTITAIGQPTAVISFSNDLNRFCLYDVLNASSNSSLFITPMTNTVWSFNGASATSSVISQNLTQTGVFPLVLSLNWNGYCQSSDTEFVYVSDPKAKLVLDKKIFCLGDVIKVSIKDTANIGGWQWFFGDFVPQIPVTVGNFTTSLLPNPYPYVYSTYPNNGNNGTTTLSLEYYAGGKTCRRSDTITIQVIKVESDFEQIDKVYIHCLGLSDRYNSTFLNPLKFNLTYGWEFAGTKINTGPTPAYTFTQAGIFPVTLTVTNTDYGCKSVSIKNMTILPMPKANILVADTTCPNNTFSITGSGLPGVSGQVKGVVLSNSRQDSVKFTSQNTFSLNTSATVSTTYSLIVTDENGCVSMPAVDSIYVQQKPNLIHWDTTVIIGEEIPINAFIGKNYSYTWTPIFQNLSCTNCYNPISNTTVNLTYTLVVEDKPLACFLTEHTFSITINPKTSIDVPSAFTPNGDGINDIVYVGGWGIRKLLYFKIFNRWGQLVFQTNDLKTGWDGKYEGIPQNMETYVFEAAVETYLDNTLTKSGTIKIIR